MINTLTLNPGLDHILYLDHLQKNITNRLKASLLSIGGKGTHVSINLGLMGTESRAFGFSFGKNGKMIQEMLSRAGVSVAFIHSEEGESRDNYLLVEEETQDCTLLTERGPQPDEGEVNAFFDLLLREIQPDDDLVLSGDVSNFSKQDIYGQVQGLLREKGLRVFLDASGPSLSAGIRRKPFLIKPNLDELSFLTGKMLVTTKDIVSAVKGLDGLGIEVIAVSMGGRGSLVRAGDRMFRVTPPKVTVRNTIGCGDCYIAGLLHGLNHDFDMEHAIRYATAVSAAAAESGDSVGFDPQRADELLQKVEITRV
jgi:1-phosphofructokinase family hexose kinase